MTPIPQHSSAQPEFKPPAGFSLAPLDEGFLNLVGPLYGAQDGAGVWVIALKTGPQHSNRYGVVHGGLLSTLADVAIGMNLSRAGAVYADSLTVNLSIDFLGSCEPGDWVEAHVNLTKRHGRVRFGECRLLVGDRMVVRASAVFFSK